MPYSNQNIIFVLNTDTLICILVELNICLKECCSFPFLPNRRAKRNEDKGTKILCLRKKMKNKITVPGYSREMIELEETRYP